MNKSMANIHWHPSPALSKLQWRQIAFSFVCLFKASLLDKLLLAQ